MRAVFGAAVERLLDKTVMPHFHAAFSGGTVLSALVGAGMLAITGYVAKATSQSPETLFGIKAVMTIYPAIALTIAAVIIYFLYSLSDDKYHAIAIDLEEGRWEKGIIGEEIAAKA